MFDSCFGLELQTHKSFFLKHIFTTYTFQVFQAVLREIPTLQV